jgi:hypothetical protein
LAAPRKRSFDSWSIELHKGSKIKVVAFALPVVGNVKLTPNMRACHLQLLVIPDELMVVVVIKLDILRDFPQNSFVEVEVEEVEQVEVEQAQAK